MAAVRARTRCRPRARRPRSLTAAPDTRPKTRPKLGSSVDVWISKKSYDSLGRLTDYSNGAGSHVGYGYNLRNLLTTLTYPNGQPVGYTYDDAGDLASLTDWLTNRYSITHDEDNNRAGIAYPNGITATYTYDRADRLTGITHANGATTLASFGYGLTNTGLASSLTTTGTPQGNETYTFNTLDQLTGANGDAYSYDSTGNLTAQPGTASATYDKANQLCWTNVTSAGTPTCGTPPASATTYAYNTRGDRTTRAVPGAPTATYGYDQANRLISYASGPTSASYGYDGDGLRQAKTVGAATSQFTYNPAGTIPLLLSDGSTSYLYANGLPIAQITGTTPTYLHTDRLGTPRVATDNTGAVTGTIAYDAYGNPAGSTGNPPGLGFAGEYTDTETGLVYLRARYYDPTTAQFLTRDPLEAISRSAYGYVNNDPLDATDPLGLMCFKTHCLLHDVSQATTIVQTGLDVVAVGAAAAGAEPVAGALLGVSQAVGYVNVAATCADWATGAAGAASGTDCAVSVVISIGTAGLGRLVAPGLSRNGAQVFDQVELAARGSINAFGDLVGWERGWKTGDSSPCPGPRVQPELRPAL